MAERWTDACRPCMEGESAFTISLPAAVLSRSFVSLPARNFSEPFLHSSSLGSFQMGHILWLSCSVLLLPAPLPDLLARRFQRKKEMMRRIPARSAEAIISEGGTTPLLHRHSCSTKYTSRASLHHRGGSGIPYTNRSGLSILSALECNLAQRLVENRRDDLGSGLGLWV